MKCIVGFVHAAKAPRFQMTQILLVQSLQLGDHRCRCGQRNAQRGLALQQLAHFVDLPHFARRQRAHRRALVLFAHHDAGALELMQGLPDEVARRAEARNQVVFDQPRAGREAAEDDVFAELFGDVFGHIGLSAMQFVDDH